MQRLLYTVLALLCSAQVFAQAPEGITYQAVARGNAGNVLPDSALTVRMGILLGNPSGDLLWQEIHAVNTNSYGLFDLVIGQGDGTGAGALASFADINWGNGTFFLRVEVDPEGLGIFDIMGESQFLSVPYALHAATVAGLADVDQSASNECITDVQLNGDTLTLDQCGTTWEVPLGELQDDDWQTSSDGTALFNTAQNVGIGTAAPSSTLHVLGSFSAPISSVTGPSTVILDTNTYTYVFDTSDGDVTAILPAASSCYGRMYVVKAFTNGESNSLNLVTDGTDTIDGQDDPAIPVTTPHTFTLQSDGDQWWVIQGQLNP